MNKRKVVLIIGVLILVISVPVAILVLKQGAIFKLGAQTVNKAENVQVVNITEKSATITWTTQKATQGLINYGISPTNLTLVQIESSPAINHQINLINLLPATTYFFTIKIGNQTFDNNGQPFTFTTKTKATFPSPSPSPSPSPISTPTPTSKPTTTSSPTLSPPSSLTEEGFQTAIGTNNPTYDLNKDGIVNTADLLLFRQQQNK
jgi:hypothetical protein